MGYIKPLKRITNMYNLLNSGTACFMTGVWGEGVLRAELLWIPVLGMAAGWKK
jgi:hypothetical protein